MSDMIIISEHRVGSRWMHYLFAGMLNRGPSPEMDGDKLYLPEQRKQLIQYLKQDRIPKLHHATPNQTIEAVKLACVENKYPANIKVLGIVRHPRDRTVSFSFHQRFHKRKYDASKDKEYLFEQTFETDKEAMRYTAIDSAWNKREDVRQIELMLNGFSTEYYNVGHNNREHFNTFPYIWTTYEKLKEDTVREVKILCDFFQHPTPDLVVAQAVKEHSFKSKSGRDEGVENKADEWRRKGVTGDWENYFDSEMVARTQFVTDIYNQIVERNFNL